MATAKEKAAIIAPILAEYPDWRYARGWLFRLPIGYYVRGVSFQASWSDRKAYQILRCVFPLFDFTIDAHFGWSMSYPIPGTPNHGWNVFHPDFADALVEVMDKEINPKVAHIQKGSDFLRYLTEHYTMHGWQDTGKALAYVHMGELRKAREHLIATVEHLEMPGMERLTEPGAWGGNVLELLRLIEQEPEAIPAHCEAVARQSVKRNKLEKFWEPTPFVYDNAVIC